MADISYTEKDTDANLATQAESVAIIENPKEIFH